MILRQILPQGRRQCIRLRLLEEAVLHLHHLMAAGPIKAHPAVGGHRVLALIAVAQGCAAPKISSTVTSLPPNRVRAS